MIPVAHTLKNEDGIFIVKHHGEKIWGAEGWTEIYIYIYANNNNMNINEICV
jgi:hypothetical protein